MPRFLITKLRYVRIADVVVFLQIVIIQLFSLMVDMWTTGTDVALGTGDSSVSSW